MMRRDRAIIVAVVAVITLGCRDMTGAHPASLTGSWSLVSSGVDFVEYFNLIQNGSVVAGEFVYMLGSGVDSVAVTGLVNSRQVLLQWRPPLGTEIDQATLQGQLLREGQSITGAYSVNGGPPVGWTLQRFAETN